MALASQFLANAIDVLLQLWIFVDPVACDDVLVITPALFDFVGPASGR
jgi:hypothetical protein